MTFIDDTVVRGRVPRIGTITTGRGVESTSRKGSTYAKPTRLDTLCFHTNDPEVATAVQNLLGGSVESDSPTWDHDVVTDARQVDVMLLPQGFRQALELWRTAECVRRCDGVTMSTADGQPTDRPCACAEEIARGAERSCSPTTIMPVIVELEAERFGVWEVRSGSWGTAASLKGTMRALEMVGADHGTVPAVLRMVDRQVRDGDGKVWDVVELQATIAASQKALAAASRAAEAIGTPAGELDPGDARRVELMGEWTDLQSEVASLGLRDVLADDWRAMFGKGREFGDLSADELAGWLEVVRAQITDATEALAEERAESAAAGAGSEAAQAAQAEQQALDA